jgi:tRNA(adenine34) deaminase
MSLKTPPDENDDKAYMRLALGLAHEAAADGEVPVGAVVIRDGGIIGCGRNRRQKAADPTAHAEIEALRTASQAVGNWRVGGTLYVTQEPCPMCAGAVVNARIERLVYGCENPKAGSVVTLYQIPTDARLNHRCEVVGGVLAAECGAALSAFFEKLRDG